MLMFQNTTREQQVILLIIPNRERWHYLAETKLLALLRTITSKHHGDLYCLNFLILLQKETNVIFIENHVQINIFVTL